MRSIWATRRLVRRKFRLTMRLIAATGRCSRWGRPVRVGSLPGEDEADAAIEMGIAGETREARIILRRSWEEAQDHAEAWFQAARADLTVARQILGFPATGPRRSTTASATP